MKKILLAVLSVYAFTLASQAQFKVGIKAGGNLSNQQVSVPEGNAFFADKDFKTYHAGLISEIGISKHFYLQPQLLYTRKGAMLLSASGMNDTKVRINYVELPVNMIYKFNVPFGKIFGGAGASFGYGFGGKQIQNGQKQKIYKDVKTWKREDLSLCFTAGLEFNNGLFVSMNSRKGLLDVYKTDGVTVRNRSRSVSIGYLIDWNKFKKKSRG